MRRCRVSGRCGRHRRVGGASVARDVQLLQRRAQAGRVGDVPEDRHDASDDRGRDAPVHWQDVGVRPGLLLLLSPSAVKGEGALPDAECFSILVSLSTACHV